MRRLVVRGVMGEVVWVRGGGPRCRVWDLVMGCLWRPQEGGHAVVCVGGGIDINRLVGGAACCLCGLVSRGVAGGGWCGGVTVPWWCGRGWVLC